MKNCRQNGEVLTLPAAPSGGVSSGDAVLVNSVFGICATDAAEGAPVEITVEGCFALPKAASEMLFGRAAYWDGTKVVLTASGNSLVGVVSEYAAAADATVAVKLCPGAAI